MNSLAVFTSKCVRDSEVKELRTYKFILKLQKKFEKSLKTGGTSF
jgi:hypothetical protein